MRVIAGKAKSLPLKTVPGDGTRPTTDRIKETLFNMLQPYLPGCRFLDLFSGSGGIGIEALSRGAVHCLFVEQNRKAAACIRENLKTTHLGQEAQLLVCDAVSVADRSDVRGPYDLIFMDPPYDHDLERRVLEHFSDSSLLTEDTLIVVEASLKTDFSWLEDAGYEMLKYKKYKTNAHVFLRKKEEHQSQEADTEKP